MLSLKGRFIIAIIVIIASIVAVSPNIMVKELDIFIHSEYKSYSVEKKKTKKGKIIKVFSDKVVVNKVTDEDVNKWVSMVKNKFLRNGSLVIERQDLGKDWPANRHFVLRGRFITPAYMNKIIQADPKLGKIIDRQRTSIQIPWYPKIVKTKKGKELKFEESAWRNFLVGLNDRSTIRLGLDLQGGLSILIQGDFAGYLEEMNHRYPQSKLDDWQKKIDNPKTKKKKVDELKIKLSRAQNDLVLEEREIREFLEHTRETLVGRLLAMKYFDASVKIIMDSRSIEVRIPGVTNAKKIKDFLTTMDVVTYHLVHKDNSLLQLVAPSFQEFRKLPVSERKHFLRDLEDKYKFYEKNATVKAFYERRNSRSYMGNVSLASKESATIHRVPEIVKPNVGLVPRYFLVLNSEASLDGTDVESASAVYDRQSLQNIVSFQLNSDGAKKFYNVTKINKGRRLAILIGDKVRSAPNINEAIAGGRAQISGSFTPKETQDIAQIMKEGALQIPLKVIKERNIGATLGEQTIANGVRAILVGFLAVVLFMLVWYLMGGVIANMALLLNLLVLGALLSLGGITLTLPGFAGIILTLGMAVDTNVIIFERIKEELRTGKTLPQSIEFGYSRALWTVLDSNITTLIASVILFKLGEEHIKSFAATLGWGIISSLVTGLFMTRIIFDFLASKRIKKLPLAWTKQTPDLATGKLEGEAE